MAQARSIECQFADLPQETEDHLGLFKFEGSFCIASVSIPMHFGILEAAVRCQQLSPAALAGRRAAINPEFYRGAIGLGEEDARIAHDADTMAAITEIRHVRRRRVQRRLVIPVNALA